MCWFLRRVSNCLFTVLSIVVLIGCGTRVDGPAIATVRPAIAAPGGMVLLSGSGFARGDTVWVSGRELPNVSWVNETLIATTLPAELPEGSHALEVRAASGRRSAASVQVVAPHPPALNNAAPPPEQAAPSPEPTATPKPEATPMPISPPAAAPPRPANPPGGEKNDNKDKDKDNGRGNGNQGGRGNGRGR